MNRTFLSALLLCVPLLGCIDEGRVSSGGGSPGTRKRPLRVVLVPADGGTEEGTKADFEPIFKAVSASSGLHFLIQVGQSYSAVVEAMVGGRVDIAFFGPVTYHQARTRGAAELLAVAETDGSSVYYAGIFCRKESGWTDIRDLQGRSVAFGDINSTSSFHYPVAMLLEADIDPARDLTSVYITGSHTNSLQALVAGRVDVACAALESYAKAIRSGKIGPDEIQLVVKSDPIPYPPLAMAPRLPSRIKVQLKDAFHRVHQQPGLDPQWIRGYGGLRVDRYNAFYPQEHYDRSLQRLSLVTRQVKESILRKAG